jgi:hypothetical protein
MLKLLSGLFIVLHGLVHLWYVVLSYGLVEFQPGMGWTGESWLLSRVMGSSTARSVAGVLYVVAALGFVAGGVGIFADAEWQRPLLLGPALFSAALVLLYWDGGTEMIVQKGLVGLMINAGIVVMLTLFQ